MKFSRKECEIILPNHEISRAGKVKAEGKLLEIVRAEYDISEDDIAYFRMEKEKNKFRLRLVFVPRSASDLSCVNAKKFLIFDLIRINLNCVLHIDDDLNKQATVLQDLVNNDDPNAKETIKSKISNILDAPEELDGLLDRLLTDHQFNSFKYSVLNSQKMSCLLCVNGDGLFVRSFTSPYDVEHRIEWQNISCVKCKRKKLIFLMRNGTAEEISFLTVKSVKAAHIHLENYLRFINEKRPCSPFQPQGFFARIASRIRRSFSKRPASTVASQNPTPHSTVGTSPAPTQLQHAASHTITSFPESSFVSEECHDIPVSKGEPSVKTNSTYDVSLGSESSFRPPAPAAFQEEETIAGGRQTEPSISSFQKPTSTSQWSDDHFSVKTTSTYEVSLETVPTVTSGCKQTTNESRGDHEGSPTNAFAMTSFSQAPEKKSPPLAQLKKEPVFQQIDSKTTNMAPEPPVRATETVLSNSPSLGVTPVVLEHVEEPVSSQSEPSIELEERKPELRMEEHTETVVHVEEFTSGTIVVGETEEKTQVKMDTEPEIEAEVETLPPPQETIFAHEDNTEAEAGMKERKTDSRLPVSKQRSIPSPKIQRPNRVISSPQDQVSFSSTPVRKIPSPSDKENFESGIVHNGSPEELRKSDNQEEDVSENFSRFQNEEYKVDSQTTFTSISTVGDNIIKKSTKTEVATVKNSTGIPAPKQYRTTTTTITSTTKKPSDAPKSPGSGQTKIPTGIPRMSSAK